MSRELLQPTDEQIDALWRKSCELNELTRDMVRHFARAVLAAQPLHEQLREMGEAHAAQPAPVPERWVVVCETILDVGHGKDVRTGGKPELGYALLSHAVTFPDEDAARAAHRSADLPLGWVIMPLSRLLPDLPAAPVPDIVNPKCPDCGHRALGVGCDMRVPHRAAQPAPVPCARNELVTAIHSLASNFENSLYAFRNDTEARRKATGDIAHAMKIAAKHNQNGSGCSAAPVPAPLTDEKIDAIANQPHGGVDPAAWFRNAARAIERAHGIGIAASPEKKP